MVKDRESGHAAVCGVARRSDMTEQLNNSSQKLGTFSYCINSRNLLLWATWLVYLILNYVAHILKWKLIGEINFNIIFNLSQYVQNIIVSTCHISFISSIQQHLLLLITLLDSVSLNYIVGIGKCIEHMLSLYMYIYLIQNIFIQKFYINMKYLCSYVLNVIVLIK